MFGENDKNYHIPSVNTNDQTVKDSSNKSYYYVDPKKQIIKPLDMRSVRYIWKCHNTCKKSGVGFSYIYGILFKIFPKFFVNNVEIKGMTPQWESVIRDYWIVAVQKLYHYMITLGLGPVKFIDIEYNSYKYRVPYVPDITDSQIYCIYSQETPEIKKYIYQHNTTDLQRKRMDQNWYISFLIKFHRYAYDENIQFIVNHDIDLKIGDTIWDVVYNGWDLKLLKHGYDTKWGKLLCEKIRIDRLKEFQLRMESEKTKTLNILEDKRVYNNEAIDAEMKIANVIAKGDSTQVIMTNPAFSSFHSFDDPDNIPITEQDLLTNPNLIVQNAIASGETVHTASYHGEESQRRYTDDETAAGLKEMEKMGDLTKKAPLRNGVNEFIRAPPNKKPIQQTKYDGRDITIDIDNFSKDESRLYCLPTSTNSGSNTISAETLKLEQKALDYSLGE